MSGSLRIAAALVATAFAVPLPASAMSARYPFRIAPATISATNTRTPIKHVIVVVMENRSFDNVFSGFPKADSVTVGKNHLGQPVPLQLAPFEGNCDPDHSHEAWVKDYAGGKMNGFDLAPPSCVGTVPSNGSTVANYPYGYVPYAEVKPYWDIATQFGVADRMFASQSGPSYPGHMYIVAGTSGNQTDDPSNALVWGCDSPAGTTVPYLGANGQIAGTQFPCLFTQPTMGNLLDTYAIPWAYYSNNLSYTATGQEYDVSTQPYDAFFKVRGGADWQADIIAKQGGSAREFADISDGTLPPVSWFNPPVIASDHAQDSTNFGPDYVATLANTLMATPYWNDTVILVTWDDPGGWYDHVKPQQLDRNGLGFRVPLLVISKYSKRGYVSHVQHEYGSLLKFIEYNWGLPSLKTTDARADNLLDFFDFTSQPLPTKPIVTVHGNINESFFLKLPLDTEPLDYTPAET